MKTIEKVEIFAVGKWNGMVFTKKDLEGIAAAFNKLKAIHLVPLKFGHNDEQPLTDGQPALGWVDNVWVDGDVLFAKFTDIPDVVYSAIERKAYRTVSVELDMMVSHSGVDHPLVLSGVALLGADIPAVNVTKELMAYMTKLQEKETRLSLSGNRKIFTAKGERNMPTVEELQAKLDAAVAEVKASKEKLDLVSSESAKFKREAEESKKAQEVARFAAEKASLTTSLEELVKGKVITPAKREDILKQFKEDDAVIGGLKFTIETLKGMSMKTTVKEGEEGSSESGEEGSPDKIILSRINKMRSDNPTITFSAAKERVMKSDPELSRAYVNMTKEV